jgi:hypothetical protein
MVYGLWQVSRLVEAKKGLPSKACQIWTSFFLSLYSSQLQKPSLTSENPEMGDICINLMLAIDLLENPTGWCCDSCQWTSDWELVGILSTIQICSTTMDKNQVQVFMAIQRYFRRLPCHAMPCSSVNVTLRPHYHTELQTSFSYKLRTSKSSKMIFFCVHGLRYGFALVHSIFFCSKACAVIGPGSPLLYPHEKQESKFSWQSDKTFRV